MAIFKRGKFYWYSFTHCGRRIQKSTKQGDREQAKTLMGAERSRLARVDAGLEPAEPIRTQPSLTISALLDALENDYKLRGKGSVRNLSHISRVREDFGKMKTADLTAEKVDAYIQRRLDEGCAAASINRVTQLLGQAYKLAIARKQVATAPVIRRLSEKGNARQGFFSDIEFRALQSHLPADLQDFAGFAYLTGWRKGEVASLRWEDVQDGMVRLRGVDAKNGDPRAVVLQGELAKLIRRRMQARAVKTEQGSVAMATWIFHRQGHQIREFRKSWKTACDKAGVQRLFHDLRRTAARNLIRAGVPERTCMAVTGHRTRAIFDRYNIVDEHDLAAAMKRVDRYLKTAKENVVPIGATASR